MIEGLILPDLALAIASLIDAMSRFAFYGVHDLWNGKRSILIGKRSQYQVNMIWHYNCRMQDAFLVVDVNACFQSQVSGELGEMPALMRSESDEEGFVVFLNVR